MITKEICIEEILDAPIGCGSVEPVIQWIIPNSDCIASPCVECEDECITVEVVEGCSDNYIQVVLTYPGSSCPDIIRNIGVCSSNNDCSNCENCEEGVCVEKCNGPCDKHGICVDCLDDTYCEGDKKCINGSCQCPPGTTDLGNGVCAECYINEDCPECENCVNHKCLHKVCPGGHCLEDSCVECIKNSHCGPNECCNENNKCECCVGYEFDYSTNTCQPKGECEETEDCGDCRECVGGNCVEKVCPEGYSCYKDECYKECSQEDSICDDSNLDCVSLGDKSICIECPECEDTAPDRPGEGSNPNPESPSNPGTPCTMNSDCEEGEECSNGACIECEECVETPCIENFQINRDNEVCRVEGILNTTNECDCLQLTWSVEVYERDQDRIKFRLRLRQGNAFVEGINNIPLLRDLGIANPFPTLGEIKIKTKASGIYEDHSLGRYYETKEVSTESFIGTDEIVTSWIKLDKPGSSCIQASSGKKFKINDVNISFVLPPMSLQLDSGCTYTVEEKKISYSINKEGGNGYLSNLEFYETTSNLIKYYTLTGIGERNPIFYWYSGDSPETSTLIRKSYSSKVSTNTFRDAWLGREEGVTPGKYLRLESDCSCGGKTYFNCEGQPARLYYCSPEIGNLNYYITKCNTHIELYNNDFSVCDSNKEQGYELLIDDEVVDTFYPEDGELYIEGEYSFEDPVRKLQIKLEGVECENCYPPINLEIPEYSFEYIDYDCVNNILSVNISGGSGNYSVKIDDNSWTIGDPITLSDGEHLIEIEDIVTECVTEFLFEVDCCDIFKIDTEDLHICGDSIDSFTFEVSGGSPDYEWTAYESKGGAEIDNGTSGQEEVTILLNEYDKDRIYIVVKDDHDCEADKLIRIHHEEQVAVEVSNRSYCEGDDSKEVNISIVAGTLPVDYELVQGGSTLKTGTFTSSNSLLEIENPNENTYTLRVEDANGCKEDKPIVLNENPCPTPVITVDEPDYICEGKELVIKADITNGTNPYSWSIEYNSTEIASGTGSSINYSTGIIYSINPGIYSFDIKVVDVNNKEASAEFEVEVLEEGDPECVECSAEPNISISSDKGWEVEPDEVVKITSSISGESITWYVNNQPAGQNEDFYPDTSTVGSYLIYAEVEYEPHCFVQTQSRTLNVTEPCECEYGIRLKTGWGDDNGEIIRDTTTVNPVCLGDDLWLEAVEYNCSNNLSYDWSLYNSSVTVSESGTNKDFSAWLSKSRPEDRYFITLTGWDDGCSIPPVTFEVRYDLCRECNISLGEISDITVCDGETVSVPTSATGIWNTPGGVKFRYKVNGSTYAEFPSGSNVWTCEGQTTCSRSQNITGLSVGTHNLEVEVWEQGATECSDSKTATITVRPISHESCRDCGSNTANITVSGCSGTSGDCNMYGVETSTVTLNASATGSPGGFSYQWKQGNNNIGSGNSVQVGPYSVGSNVLHRIEVTDAHGCVFSRNVRVQTIADCSGRAQVIVNKNEACSGETVNVSWDLSQLHNKEQYTVTVYARVGNTSTAVPNGSNRPWNGSVNVTMPNNDVRYFIEAKRVVGPNTLCTKESSQQLVELVSCVDCSGTVSSISASNNSLCATESTNLTANINGSTSGWTYTWTEDNVSGSPTIGTGTTISNYTPSTLPVTVRVTGVKSGCSNTTKTITISEKGDCCNGEPNPSIEYSNNFCNDDTVTIKSNGTSDWDTKAYVRSSSCSGTPIDMTNQGVLIIQNVNVGEKITVCWSRPECPSGGGSKTFTIEQQQSCCTLDANPKATFVGLSSPSNNEGCPNGGFDLASQITGSKDGYTFEWKVGNNTIGTTENISNWTSYPSLPFTVTFEAKKTGCPTVSKNITITESSQCCAGKPTGISSQNGTNLCPGGQTSLTAIGASTGGNTPWTYTWREGTTAGGTKLGEGSTLPDFQPDYFPYTVTLWAESDFCPGTFTEDITINLAPDCCPSGITIQKVCSANNMEIRVNGLQNADRVQFDNDPVMIGPHPSNRRTYSWNGTGIKTGVKIRVFRDTCPEEQNYEFNLDLIR